jgi:predicted transcriptional regulator
MSDTATKPAVPPPSSAGADRRQAYLLHLLAAARDRKLTRGELTKKLKTKAAQEAGLMTDAAPGLLEQLSAAGLIRAGKPGRAVVYELTDPGAAHLEASRGLLPQTPSAGGRGRVVPPPNDRVRDYRTGYLLLQVLRSPRHAVTEAEANARLDTYAREGLELNAATASHLRHELTNRGLLAASGTGRAASFSLTPAGRAAVGNLAFPPDRTFPLTGKVLNDLLEAAREVGKQFAPPTTEATGPELERGILEAFEELLRERYAVSGLVPVFEVRAAVRGRLGGAAARHDTFDEAVLRLWRAKRFRLTPIADRGKATPDQLRDAIPGMGETLFYLEAVREPAAV